MSEVEIALRRLGNLIHDRGDATNEQDLSTVRTDLARLRAIETAAQDYVDQPDPAKIQSLLDALDSE